ncbi:MAG: twin-arginine translocase TatA/TatE family subunit [Bacteroidaceae bacterium]|nr:twin-arginine translocase TatA/TatE family subunit [Bacteroidaceae bacterium]MCF0187468.1 twin-arginine translocase TatA/TatE family subunit [Bacteroidaceae bacterium]
MTISLFFGNLGGGEIFIIALVVLLLFGGKKIPELMKGLGKGVKSFKDGMNDIEEQINAEPTKKPTAEAPKSETPAEK